MFHTETVSPRILKIFDSIKNLKEISSFKLVGGTALALQSGHRESVDIDMFSDKSFNQRELEYALINLFPEMEIASRGQNGFSCRINEVRCDFYDWHVRFIRPSVEFDGINLASMEDIAAFKLDAITHRTELKDFWDIGLLLEKFSLNEMLKFYREKYPYQDIRIVMDSLPKSRMLNDHVPYKIFTKHSVNDIKHKIQSSIDVFFEEQMNKKQKQTEQRQKSAEKLLEKKKK